MSAPAGDESLRYVDLTQVGDGRFEAVNRRGGVLRMGQGDEREFTPVELLLAALAGCGAIDTDLITRKRSAATRFDVRAEGHKIRDELGNHLVDLRVTFSLEFPEGEDGDRAREVVPRTLQMVTDRLCTVGRTVAIGEPVAYVEADPA
jgi:putative redox protein